jgi:2-succinyl-5-enolpyruvyl-6-hydroxy-3-cyclohexene-1-carboxylate synthase
VTHPNPSTALARVVVDELAARGVELVVVSPGSRSGALAIAAAQSSDLAARVVIDERSAAFHALGAARATGLPVAVVATSGSAPANFFPAIVEADMSCVPLFVVSADRPAEMQGVGANQTINQVAMFGSKVRAYAGIEAPDASEDANARWRKTVSGLVAAAGGARPGPVHLNVRFREPTAPVTDDGRSAGQPYPYATPRLGDGNEPVPDPEGELPRLAGGRGIVIAGDGDYDRDGVAAAAAALGWPTLATAQSGMRGGDVVSTYHHILSGGVPDALTPETVVAIGAIGPSIRLEPLIAAARERVRIDRWGRSIDPAGQATHVLRGDVVSLLGRAGGSADPEWKSTWNRAETATRERIDFVLQASNAMSGAAVMASLNEIDWGALVAASSLPIREADAHLRRAGPVFANRGASGIDGFVSTALGVAASIPRSLAVAGDLSLLHDSNGFLHDGRIDLSLVVIDNGGGGLFDSLPQARHAPDFERLFITDPGRSFEELARFHRLRFAEARDPGTLQRLVAASLDRHGVDLIRVPVDRRHDLEVRAQLDG